MFATCPAETALRVNSVNTCQHPLVAYSVYMQPKFATSEQVRQANRLVLRDYGRVFQWLACDESLQECGLCHDLFDIQQVRVQFSGQVLCDRCAALPCNKK
jgi:hypothetical protein